MDSKDRSGTQERGDEKSEHIQTSGTEVLQQQKDWAYVEGLQK